MVNKTAVSNDIEAMIAFVRHSSCHRSVRSASAPPINEIEIMAMPGIALTKPINIADSVRSSTIHAWAIFLIWYPANVARFAMTNSR